MIPGPFDILLDPLSLTVIAMYGLMMTWESLFPAQPLPRVRGWKVRGVLFFFAFFFLSTYLPLWLDPWLERWRLLDLTGMPVWMSSLAGILLYELAIYGWHFMLHRSDFLWRTFHQMHHSAERLDTFGAFFFSPLDMLGWTLIGSLCFALIVGLPPASVTAVLLVTTFFSMFQHANIRTPVWLGYIIQRPESHALHHARGVHRWNYSDLPLFDLLFGTFHNPRQARRPDTGFYDGASGRIRDMLLGKNIAER